MKVKHLSPKLLLLFFFTISISSCGSEAQTQEAEEPTLSDEEAKALAATYADTAQLNQYVLWNWEGAESYFKKALELDPNIGRAHAHYGWLYQLRGEKETGIEKIKMAIQVEPNNPLWHAWHGWMLLWEEDAGEAAMEAAKGGLEVDSSFSVSHYILGTVYNDRGESDKALEHLEMAAKDPMFVFSLGVGHAKIGNTKEALDIVQQLADTGETWNTWGIAEIYSTLGDKEKAMEWVQKAYDQKHPYIPWIEKNPILAALSDQPGYQEIVESMNLPGS